jgi:HlyD family secretion protein
MTASRFILLLVLLGIVFGGGWFAGSSNPQLLSPVATDSDEAKPEPPQRVVAQGRIVPAGGIFNVIAPPGQLIEQVLVKESDPVVADETRLAVLAGETALGLQTELVDAQSQDAMRELDQKILAAENGLLTAKSAVETALLQQSQAEQAIDLSVAEKQISAAYAKISRLQSLAGDPDTMLYVSQSALSDQQLKIDQFRSDLDAAKRKQTAAIEAARLAVEVSEKSKDAARKSLQSLLGLRKENKSVEITQKIADDRLQKARITAPVDGTVLKVFVKNGEAISNTPLMQIGNLNEMECVAEVVDRLVGGVEIGQSVSLTSPALSREIRGTVSNIGRFVGKGTMLAPSPLALVDRKTVDVRIKINAEDVELASKLVNLQVDVEIDTN